MKEIIEFSQVVISVILSVCSLCLLAQSIIVESPMKGMAIAIFSIIFIGCIYMLKTTYKEYKAEINH